jgi:hypothetical protein
MLGVLAGAFAAPTGDPETSLQETIRVDLRLLTGGQVSGLVIDHTDVGLVIAAGSTPLVFAWEEVETGSAYRARRALLVLRRGAPENLTAEDHFQLGVFALGRGRPVVARNEFRQAERLDRSYESRVDAAIEAHRKHRLQENGYQPPLEQTPSDAGSAGETKPGLSELIDVSLARSGQSDPAGRVDFELRVLVRAVYDTFAQTVREQMGKDVVLVETDHFLIWTDWDKSNRQRLAGWCETMYEALCRQFGFDPQEDLFLAKCPVFCWRSKTRFLKFARLFDGYSESDAVGYTRSIEASGHVHVVLYLTGRTEADYDYFAATLVHEGTHAFIHRFHSSRLIPHWVNEGCAELMSERVLGARSFAGEKADLLARQYARYDWSITEFLRGVGPIEVHQYPLAASVIGFLEAMDPAAFARFIRSLKDGVRTEEALAINYPGMDLARLEAAWRNTIGEEKVRAFP